MGQRVNLWCTPIDFANTPLFFMIREVRCCPYSPRKGLAHWSHFINCPRLVRACKPSLFVLSDHLISRMITGKVIRNVWTIYFFLLDFLASHITKLGRFHRKNSERICDFLCTPFAWVGELEFGFSGCWLVRFPSIPRYPLLGLGLFHPNLFCRHILVAVT